MKGIPQIVTEIQGERTQAQLAEDTGLSTAMISSLKSGSRGSNLGQKTVSALLQVAMPEQQAALLRAVIADDNFEVLVFEDDGQGGVILRRINGNGADTAAQ